MIGSILSLFFYLFSSVTLISSIMVILSSNPVYSALFLVLVFFNSALIVLLLDLEFLALIFVIIYIGAIMVLVLFIIMMLDIKHTAIYLNVQYYFFISGLFLVFLSSEFLYFLNLDLVSIRFYFKKDYLNWFGLILEFSNIKTLGTYLYTYFSFFLLMAGLILLIAMIGAITLTVEDFSTKSDSKHQLLFKQVTAHPKDSLFYYK